MAREDSNIRHEKTLIILSAKCDKNGNLNSLRKVGINDNSVIDLQLESLEIKFDQKFVVLGEKRKNGQKKGLQK